MHGKCGGNFFYNTLEPSLATLVIRINRRLDKATYFHSHLVFPVALEIFPNVSAYCIN